MHSHILSEEDFLQAIYILLVAGLAMFLMHIMESNKIKWISAIPESGVVIIIGIAFGFLGWLTDAVEIISSSKFSNHLFELVFLPAIIFEAGYTLKKKGMFKNFRPILLYAIAGTFISTFVTALAVHYLSRALGIAQLNFLECLIFGALISATDTVATLAVFHRVFGLDQETDQEHAPLLYHLVFGESVLNDAVAICLFNTFDGFASDPVFDENLMKLITLKFLSVCFFSVVIGVSAGLFSALVTRWTRFSENHKFDLIFMYMCAYGGYFVAAYYEYSGLLSIFFAGVVMGHYTWYNLSAFAQISSPILVKSIANLCDMLVFCFLGMALFGSPEVRHAWSLSFNVMVLGIITVVRFAAVFGLTPIGNWGRKRKINFKEQVVISYASLRGALAFALSLKCLSLGIPHAPLIVSCTMTLAVFTILFQGTTMLPLMKALGMGNKVAEEDMPESELLHGDLIGSYGGVGDAIQGSSLGTPEHWWARLDRLFLQPLFVANPVITGGQTKQKFSDLGRALTSLIYLPDSHDERHTALLSLLNKFHEIENRERDLRNSVCRDVDGEEIREKRKDIKQTPRTPEKDKRQATNVQDSISKSSLPSSASFRLINGRTDDLSPLRPFHGSAGTTEVSPTHSVDPNSSP